MLVYAEFGNLYFLVEYLTFGESIMGLEIYFSWWNSWVSVYLWWVWKSIFLSGIPGFQWAYDGFGNLYFLMEYLGFSEPMMGLEIYISKWNTWVSVSLWWVWKSMTELRFSWISRADVSIYIYKLWSIFL